GGGRVPRRWRRSRRFFSSGRRGRSTRLSFYPIRDEEKPPPMKVWVRTRCPRVRTVTVACAGTRHNDALGRFSPRPGPMHEQGTRGHHKLTATQEVVCPTGRFPRSPPGQKITTAIDVAAHGDNEFVDRVEAFLAPDPLGEVHTHPNSVQVQVVAVQGIGLDRALGTVERGVGAHRDRGGPPRLLPRPG